VARAVASAEPLVESAASNEACVDVKDIVPPSPPAGLTALARAEGVEVTWSPSAEADIHVYRLYRTFRRQREKLVELTAPETSYLDATAPPGSLVRYTVTAVDHAGNESGDAEPAEARRP
jgi:fibronectin type 3 domain-containing protein